MTVDGYAIQSQYMADSVTQLLMRPVSTLLDVSSDGAKVLESLGIITIFDLAASSIFDSARQIVLAASQPPGLGTDHIAGDFVDSSYRDRTPRAVAAASLAAMRSIGEVTAKKIKDVLGLSTIQELANWPPYRVARSILNDAYGLSPTTLDDPERPDDLIPIARRYATERIQYDVIVMDRVLVNSENEMPKDLVTAGGIDVSDIVSAALVARPAIGAVLTYRQSWFPQGLALGHLLHSMALAPGESTRIAMVDWTRTVRARTDEDTTQTESLMAELTHTRAMQEVTASVAREAQSGFSFSTSEAHQEQSGETTGEASVGLRTPGLLETLAAGLIGGEKVGLSMGSSGTSHAKSDTNTKASGWAASSGERSLNAEMMQNITDRTHQAANSVRNRRATSIMETSQKENETLSTRVVSNYNHMHALTIQYFEVVQIYRVVVELARATRCLFVPMKLVTFTSEVIKRYRNVIADAALIPDVRALAWAQPNQVMVVPPNKAGQWDSTSLSIIKKALGDEVGTPNGTAIFLPIDGLLIYGLEGWDQQFYTLFSSLEVTLRNGQHLSYRINPDDYYQRSVFGPIVIPYNTDELRLRDGGDILKMSLIRSNEQESASGTLQVGLTFDVIYSTTLASDRAGAYPNLRVKVPINFKENEAETVVFQFERSPIEADIIEHLQQNALHYSSAIWRSLDAATITTMLATYGFHGRPLIELIDPIPVTINGNYVVFRYYGDNDIGNWKEFLQKHDLKNPKPIEDLVPLPSGGVFAEAVLGRSNSAEKLDITRFWNWQDSPIPILPPEIAPLQAGGKANDPNLKTGVLEGQVLNIVNPPSLPDPTGLAPLYNAIANGNMFRDMSGLAQTAALAQAALQAAQAGAGQATTAAGQAQQVAAQQLTEMLKTIGQVALAAMTGTGSGGSSAGAALLGALTGGGNPGVTKSPTNAGALINQGRSMDERGVSGSATPAKAPPAGSGVGITNSSGSGSHQVDAFDAALGGGGSGVLNQLLKTVLGTSPAPATPPPGSARASALTHVAAFKAATSTSPWKLSRSEVADRLTQLINKPSCVYQDGLNLCGPAAFLRLWVQRDPLTFAKFATELYETGSSYIGTLGVKPSSDLISQDYALIKSSHPDIPLPTDWMVLSALRDSENWVFDYQGTPDEDISAITLPGTVIEWLRATGIYSTIHDDTNLYFTKGLAHAISLVPAPNRDIILLINSSMLPKGSPVSTIEKLFPNHFIVLNSPIIVTSPGVVELNHWSWGSDDTISIARATFETNYYGAVIAER